MARELCVNVALTVTTGCGTSATRTKAQIYLLTDINNIIYVLQHSFRRKLKRILSRHAG